VNTADNKHAVAEVDCCCPDTVIEKNICGSGVDIMPCHVGQKRQSWQIASEKNN